MSVIENASQTVFAFINGHHFVLDRCRALDDFSQDLCIHLKHLLDFFFEQLEQVCVSLTIVIISECSFTVTFGGGFCIYLIRAVFITSAMPLQNSRRGSVERTAVSIKIAAGW